MSSLTNAGVVSTTSGVGRPSDSYYPSPFFDVARTYLPRSVTDTYDWCEFYARTNPMAATIIRKLATYAITDLIFDSKEEGEIKKWKTLFHRMRIRTCLVEQGLDKNAYGTTYWSLATDIDKYLTCVHCKKRAHVHTVAWDWRETRFFLHCDKCGSSDYAKVDDERKATAHSLRLKRWAPREVIPERNPITGKEVYYYKMPNKVRNMILSGNKRFVSTIEQDYIEAVRHKKAVVMDSSKLFHMRRESISRVNDFSGLGEPILLPVMKDMYLTTVLKKSQEAVALEHIVPLRAVFPQVSVDGNNIYAQIDLRRWQGVVDREIKAWKRDPNHIANIPFPLGYQHIGGQGRAMLLHQELRIYHDMIIAGMGVPTGFFYGELQYSGGSVNLRALENEFLGDRLDKQRFIDFIIDRVAAILKWEKLPVRFKPFKMADDIQRAQFDMNLAQMKIISRRSFLSSRDYNYDEEVRQIEVENKLDLRTQREQTTAQASSRGEALLVDTRFQAEATMLQQSLIPPEMMQQGQEGQPQEGQPQEGQPQEGQPQQGQEGQPQQGAEQAGQAGQSVGGPAMDLGAIQADAKRRARFLKTMTEPDRVQALNQLRGSDPLIYNMTLSMLHGTPTEPGAPLPEQKPSTSPARQSI